MRLLWTEKVPVPERPDCVTWTSVTERERDQLRALAAHGEVLEIGSAFGFSAAAMASVASHVWCVDPHNVKVGWGNFFFEDPEPGFEDSYAAFERLLDALGLAGKVDTCFDYSHHALAPNTPFCEHLRSRVDMAFIDADHGYASCASDLRDCERIVGRGGVIACHDYGEDVNPDVAVAVDEWRQDRPMRLVDTLAIIEL